jgi:two-component system OmpR family sensor kinase
VRLAPVRGGAVLEVADGGPGMSGEDAARAFDRFHRGADRPDRPGRPGSGGSRDGGDGQDDDAAAPPGGSGLGLSIVQAIAAAHGGQAVLESRPGYGTRVRIWLPTESPAP